MTTDTLLMLDLDGTLIDTSQLYFQGVPPIVERHLRIHVPRDDLLAMWGQYARNYYAHFTEVAGRQDEGLVDTMYAEFSRFYNEMHNELSPPYEGVAELLPNVRDSVHAVVVVSTRPSSRSAPVMEMPWSRSVDGWVWGDQVERKKPAPDGIELAIRRYGVEGATCVYVGDNAHDIEAAQSARPETMGIGALWGTMDRESILGAGPDLSFETFEAFSDWVLEACPDGSSGQTSG